MNCKQGDLAYTLGKHPDYSGKIVKIHEAAKANGILPDGHPYFDDSPDPSWVIEFSHEVPSEVFSRGFRNIRFTKFGTARDCQLRPIRDGEGQDETLTWKDVPKKVTA